MPFQERTELNGSRKKDAGEGKKIGKKKGEHKKMGGGARQGTLELWEYHHPVSSTEQSLCGFLIYPREMETHPPKTQNNYGQKNFFA